MQLKHKSVSHGLAMATATLLGGIATVSHGAQTNDWEVDSGVLYYSESGRVSAIEPVVRLRRDLGDEEALSVRLVVDSLTGASANGAIPTDSPQTFTTPSGDGTYTTGANETPLDPSFHDTRVAINTQWDKPLSPTLKGAFAFNGSNEYDYTSLGLSSTLSWDINQRNTTLSAGLSYSMDSIAAAGGIPLGLSAMPQSPAQHKQILGDSDDKSVVDLLFGLTQILGRNTLMQFNYNIGRDTGYLTDPYKILSVVNANDSITLSDPPYLYEKRPQNRTRNALYWKWIHQFQRDVIHLAYRYYWDDWGIRAHTLDARYRYELNDRHYLMPHLRYAQQQRADFYHYKLVQGALPEYASADYRLADLSTTTIGLKYGFTPQAGSEFSIRAELMKQQSEGDAPFPDVDATILQLNYRFTF